PYITAFAEAGSDIITVHEEAGSHLHRTIQLIKSMGKKAGVSINPATPAAAVFDVLEEVDLVLVMSVNPGFGGQKFIPGSIGKIAALRDAIDSTGRDIDLEVDGGIDPVTAKAAIKSGADVLVAGSATFKGGRRSYAANIRRLRGGK
ncbi:MAG: ribulose-phosphate 3-epimerase, partial [Pseudomonadota bacterium]|nr:ribulose-phosphate 3-epimerase [Pseudomonadota bacterium]